MKRLLGFLLVMVMLLLFVSLPASAEVTEIQFWTWRPEDAGFYDEIISQFEHANPDIKITQNPIKNTEYNTILSAALAGDSAPDVFMSRAYGGLQTFADSGYMLALDDLIPELMQFDEAKKMGARSITDGKMYGVPAVSQTMLCFYNTKVYAELGLNVPQTWQDFIANLEATKAAGYDALANGTKEGWCCEFLFGGGCSSLHGGVDFYNKVISGETTFLDPVFVNAVNEMLTLAPYMPVMYEGVAYTDMQASFINEMSAHFIGGSYEAGYFQAQNPDLDFDIFAVPGYTEADPAYVAVYADMNFSIAATSKNQEAAIKFVKFLATPEFGNQVVADLAMVSSVPGVDVSANPFIAKVLELQKNSTPYIFLVGFRYNQPTGSSLFQAAAQGLMTNTLTAEEVCKQVQEGIATYYEPFQK
ncbi:MAG: extracellular solute-binding protein [Eubacteriales bacterium]|jgi:raffinose/stachyose/melibiose transport system substrate-binding protein|nr:extracellular solute-binding protein [Eubacteriales bacterium]MDD4105035.1 extracellular solute-binding protein [Eubacteriales bacterium]NLO14494.1 extracellular solute-binding protein [Clostridiales bacterium]